MKLAPHPRHNPAFYILHLRIIAFLELRGRRIFFLFFFRLGCLCLSFSRWCCRLSSLFLGIFSIFPRLARLERNLPALLQEGQTGKTKGTGLSKTAFLLSGFPC